MAPRRHPRVGRSSGGPHSGRCIASPTSDPRRSNLRGADPASRRPSLRSNTRRRDRIRNAVLARTGSHPGHRAGDCAHRRRNAGRLSGSTCDSQPSLPLAKLRLHSVLYPVELPGLRGSVIDACLVRCDACTDTDPRTHAPTGGTQGSQGGAAIASRKWAIRNGMRSNRTTYDSDHLNAANGDRCQHKIGVIETPVSAAGATERTRWRRCSCLGRDYRCRRVAVERH